ncbi:ferrous iron transporter B [Gammaproteobacteria bacterium SCGC AG-212-F23]|nr:ferrous iron transporter B [Gammaproteobacteria bacterium SCGC AG-212-F23]
MMTLALAGNPNSGKTTIFNALTGGSQQVGNWPGVTVERKSGFFSWKNTEIEVIDLPGTYAVSLETASLDEKITCDFLRQQQANVIINVVDASNLERHLYLTLELLEMNVPVVIALNMMDVAANRHLQIDIAQLSQKLNCPIVPLTVNKKKDIQALKDVIVQVAMHSDEHSSSRGLIAGPSRDALWIPRTSRGTTSYSQTNYGTTDSETEDADILLADARYRYIDSVLATCVKKTKTQKFSWTACIDTLVLNRFLAIPIFLLVMYTMFFFAINIGGAFQDFFDKSSETLFVSGVDAVLMQIHTPSWLISILANGIGKGINTTLTFIPVIGAMFFFLAFLEDSGYMARAAFVMDKGMRYLGLPGKSFVPMIVGFGCNVPAVLAARTLDNKRDRILTVMMSPFMSCGARLAIYAVFTAAFFAKGGQNIVFFLYLTGILLALLTGLLLRKTFLSGSPAPLIMELPPYHLPTLRALCLHAWQRLKNFVFRAGKLIVPLCIVLGMIHPWLATVGEFVTPVFSPMGIHQDNWPATVGLVTGILAKEVVVGTLNSLYAQVGHLNLQVETFHFWDSMMAAVASIPANLSHLGEALANPVLAKAPLSSVTQGVYGEMAQRFDGKVGAIAYLLFVLLYFPCVSTVAAMTRELNRGWAVFSVLWTTGVAYGVAVSFYQLATIVRHPLSSLMWMLGVMLVFLMIVFSMRYYAGGQHGFVRPQSLYDAG